MSDECKFVNKENWKPTRANKLTSKYRGGVSGYSSARLHPAAISKGINISSAGVFDISIYIANVKVCEDWDIPYVSLDEIETEDMMSVISGMEPKPQVIMSTISRVSQEAVQKQLRRLPVRTVCLDEVQVHCGDN